MAKARICNPLRPLPTMNTRSAAKNRVASGINLRWFDLMQGALNVGENGLNQFSRIHILESSRGIALRSRAGQRRT